MICASVNLGAELSYKAGGGDEHQKVRASLHLLLLMTPRSKQTCSSAQLTRRPLLLPAGGHGHVTWGSGLLGIPSSRYICAVQCCCASL